jgi:site-specific recombinase XerD
MDPTQPGSNPGERPLKDAIDDRLNELTGSYASTNETALERFRGWLARERGVTTLDAVDRQDCRAYARSLARVANDAGGELSASSARTYYACVRAFLSWAVKNAWIDTNPAEWNGATDALPEDDGHPDRQFWTDEQREQLLRYLRREADAALESDDEQRRLQVFRDRAFVHLLVYSGVRGAEVLQSPADDDRTGIRWSDVDLQDGRIHVYGKKREYEWAQLPEQAVTVLGRYERVLDPPSEGWPVFPTLDTVTLRKRVSEQLTVQGVDHDDRDDLLDERAAVDIAREYELPIPALTVAGGRTVMERLTDAGEIDVDDGEYLKPHGARRALGHKLYTEQDAELAQAALRHQSVETTHESYADVRAGETAERVSDAFEDE